MYGNFLFGTKGIKVINNVYTKEKIYRLSVVFSLKGTPTTSDYCLKST